MGYLITFEGVEGSGKTTQIRRLERYLKTRGWPCQLTREPGGSVIGDQIRKVLLSSETVELAPLGELFLYEANRAEHVDKVIRPALNRGLIVLCDRFYDATMAYQGYARGLDRDMVASLNCLASQGIVPDLTLLFDCPVEFGLKRACERIGTRRPAAREDRFERESLDFHQRVREGYLDIARREPDRVRVIDATQGKSEIHRIVCHIVDGRLREIGAKEDARVRGSSPEE
jgi:dTMP kinase